MVVAVVLTAFMGDNYSSGSCMLCGEGGFGGGDYGGGDDGRGGGGGCGGRGDSNERAATTNFNTITNTNTPIPPLIK
jgi:hypothetical protein